jgi:hypothetical protein
MSSKIHIDSITSGYRYIKSGKEYEKYFPKPDSKDRIIIEDGEVTQTVDLMKKVVWKYIDDTKQIAKVLKGSSQEQSCLNIWNFLYHHIQYKLDKQGVEELRRPARSWQDRQTGIDCDCFSNFASSILCNLQIPHSFRITKYGRNVFQHVYVVAHLKDQDYIIDPVLSKANYQKPYTENKDFPMSLNGIDIAVLSGTEDDDLYQVVMATPLDGLDGVVIDESQEAKKLYQYLVATRNTVASNPVSISMIDDPQSFIKMLDYAIKYWDTPKRQEALEILAQNEERLNYTFNLDGFEEEDEELLGRLFKRRKQRNKKGFFKNVKNAAGNLKKGAKKVLKKVVKYSPVTASARAGFLLALNLNFKKMASRLKWAYATPEQAAKKGISPRKQQQAKQALDRVERLFADKLQGKRSSLKKAILKGKSGGLNGTNGLGELGSLGEPVTATAAATMIATATPVIVATIKIMKDSGLLNPKESEEIDVTESDVTELSQYSSSDAHSGLVEDTENWDSEVARMDQPTESKGAGLVTFLKNNPLLLFGGIGALGGAGYLLFQHSQKDKGKAKTKSKPANLNGPSKRSSTSDKVKTIQLS